jgi:type II secretion system protein D
MAIRLLILIVILAFPAAVRAQVPAPSVPTTTTTTTTTVPASAGNDTVRLFFPGNQIGEIASFYEMLTGKTLVRDTNLSGPMITLTVPQPVPKSQAIALIEAALMLNGYTLVDVDARTTKLIGPAKKPGSESVPLYTDPSQLPTGDQIVSYFMPLHYLKAEDAMQVFQGYAPIHPYGSYIPVASVNAVVITEDAELVRRLVSLQQVIDVEGARTVTEFFQLERADAEKVVEILSKLFEKDDSAAASATGRPTTPVVGGAPGTAPQPRAAGAGGVSGVPAKVQVFADKRTNRVMVVAPESEIPYIRTIVENLDVAVNFDEVLERPLRFIRAADVLPVLANLLGERGDNGKTEQPQIVSADNQNGQGGGGSGGQGGNDQNGSSSSGGGSTGGGDVGLAEKTSFSAESTKPESVTVGNARIIADRSVNKILVIGPPEARDKAAKVLDMLDQRPKQVYLACVIGQLTLTNDTEFGINYLIKAGDVRILGSGGVSDINNVLANRNGSIDLVPGTSNIVNAATSAATSAAASSIPVLSGLTVFGAIGDSVDILARAMGSTGKFQVISRPVVYTANGQGALISSGQEVPVPAQSLSSVTNANVNNTGTSVATSIDYKKVVLQLDVRPLINSDHEVTLEIKQRNDNVESTTQIAGNTVPVVATQTLNTSVTVPNRSTIVLGGLISNQEDRSQTGIPFLKDIPGVGYLFSTTTKTLTKKELIVMIQPFIVNSTDSLRDVNYIERANTDFREGLFDQPVPIKRATLPGPGDITPEMVH